MSVRGPIVLFGTVEIVLRFAKNCLQTTTLSSGLASQGSKSAIRTAIPNSPTSVLREKDAIISNCTVQAAIPHRYSDFGRVSCCCAGCHGQNCWNRNRPQWRHCARRYGHRQKHGDGDHPSDNHRQAGLLPGAGAAYRAIFGSGRSHGIFAQNGVRAESAGNQSDAAHRCVARNGRDLRRGHGGRRRQCGGKNRTPPSERPSAAMPSRNCR